MKRIGWWMALVLFSSMGLRASVLQDWSTVEPKKNVGTFADENGTRLDLSGDVGPRAGEKSLRIKASIIQWGGAWAAVESDLSNAGGVKFSAKASAPGILQIGLTDDKKTQWVALVRVLSGDWEDFVVPLSRFEKTKYPMPDAPKTGVLRLAKIVGVQFQPQTQGEATLWIGPLSSAPAGAAARTGLNNPKGPKVIVQDFALLGKNAYGTFADKESGTAIDLIVGADGDSKGKWAGNFKYDLKNCGWCGTWIRSGDFWGGQDWRGARSLVLEVYSTEPLALMVSFNDANQNAYTAMAPKTRGKGWETVTIPFTKFKLDEYYQPPEAKEGAPQNLSKIETFNISPKTTGVHAFKVREVSVLKK